MAGAGEIKGVGRQVPPRRDFRGWWGLILLWLTLEIAVFSLESAQWVTPQPSLTLVLFLAMLLTWILAGRRLPGLLAHPLLLLGGAVVTIWQAALVLPTEGGRAGLYRLFQVIEGLWQPAAGTLSGRDVSGFILFIVFLTWVMGYLATWFFVRGRNAWVGASLGAAVVLVNLSNLPWHYFPFFAAYFLAAFLLIAQTRILAGREKFPGLNYPRRFWVYLMVSLLVMVVLAGSISWALPAARFSRLQTYIAARTLWKRDLEASKLNIFRAVASKQPLSTSDTLRGVDFGEVWHQGDQIDFIIRSDQPSYWMVQAYDTYTRDGWRNSAISEYALGAGETWSGGAVAAAQYTFNYGVETRIKTDILVSGGTFVAADIPAIVRAESGEIIGISAPRVMAPGERYAVRAAVARNTPEELSAASEEYPQHILENYLKLPQDLPQEIRELSANITRGANSPYEKVMALDRYLARMEYTPQVESTPADKDSVAYFLFERKSGFCVHFASAMAIMLRTVGVPSRLAIGYLPGEPAEEAGVYLLRDRFYHAWPQVYFPGHGWVDVEATPGGSESTASQVPLETPWVTGETIANLPQWDIWQALAWYGTGFEPGVPPPDEVREPPARRLPGPWAFADELARALLAIFAGIAVVLAIALPVWLVRRSFFRWLWHVDRSALPVTVYARMCAVAGMAGLGPRPQQTPIEYAANLAAVFPEQAEHLQHVARVYTESQFGRRGRLGLFEEAELLKARCRVFEALLGRLGFFRILFRQHQR